MVEVLALSPCVIWSCAGCIDSNVAPDRKLVEDMRCGEEWSKCYIELDCSFDHSAEL